MDQQVCFICHDYWLRNLFQEFSVIHKMLHSLHFSQSLVLCLLVIKHIPTWQIQALMFNIIFCPSHRRPIFSNDERLQNFTFSARNREVCQSARICSSDKWNWFKFLWVLIWHSCSKWSHIKVFTNFLNDP